MSKNKAYREKIPQDLYEVYCEWAERDLEDLRQEEEEALADLVPVFKMTPAGEFTDTNKFEQTYSEVTSYEN